VSFQNGRRARARGIRVILALAGCAIAGFVIGWSARRLRCRNEFLAVQTNWQREIDALEARIALQRLRTDNRLRQEDREAPEPPRLELLRDPKLARPRPRTTDSAAARA